MKFDEERERMIDEELGRELFVPGMFFPYCPQSISGAGHILFLHGKQEIVEDTRPFTTIVQCRDGIISHLGLYGVQN